MKQLFKPQIFKNVLIYFTLFLLVKLVWISISWIWLPTSGVEHVDQTGGKALYYRVKLTPNKISAPTNQIKQTIQNNGSINDIILLAIYNAVESSVITVRHKGKTKVLSRGDEINGFTLEGAGRNFATFTKSEKSYKVMLLKVKDSHQNTTQRHTMDTPLSPNTQSKKVSGEVIDAGDRKIVDRSLVDHYAKNMEDIYKNIGIGELKQDGNLKGFQITFVRKDSPFAKLGVQRGDMIKSINGQEINSYNAAFGVYKNIGNLNNMTLVIQRGNEEMELEYEIN